MAFILFGKSKISHNQLNKTGGNPFSGIKNAKQVNAAKHNVVNSKPIFQAIGVLYFADISITLRTREIVQSTISKIKLIMTIPLLLSRNPKVKKSNIKSP